MRWLFPITLGVTAAAVVYATRKKTDVDTRDVIVKRSPGIAQRTNVRDVRDVQSAQAAPPAPVQNPLLYELNV